MGEEDEQEAFTDLEASVNTAQASQVPTKKSLENMKKEDKRYKQKDNDTGLEARTESEEDPDLREARINRENMLQQNMTVMDRVISALYNLFGRTYDPVFRRDVKNIRAKEERSQDSVKKHKTKIREYSSKLVELKSRMAYLEQRLDDKQNLIGAYDLKISEVKEKMRSLGKADNAVLESLISEYAPVLKDASHIPVAEQKSKLMEALTEYVADLEIERQDELAEYDERGLELEAKKKLYDVIDRRLQKKRRMLTVSSSALADTRSKRYIIEEAGQDPDEQTDLGDTVTEYVTDTQEAKGRAVVTDRFVTAKENHQLNLLIAANKEQRDDDEWGAGADPSSYENERIKQRVEQARAEVTKCLYGE